MPYLCAGTGALPIHSPRGPLEDLFPFGMASFRGHVELQGHSRYLHESFPP